MYKSKDFYSITFFKNDNRYVPISNLKTFDELQFHLKDKDNTYKIHAVTGAKHMSDMNKCLQELNVIEKDFQRFKDIRRPFFRSQLRPRFLRLARALQCFAHLIGTIHFDLANDPKIRWTLQL